MTEAWPEARCASTSAPRLGWARRSPCSPRAGAGPSAAPTSSSGWWRPTAGRSPPPSCRTWRSSRGATVSYRGSTLTEMDLDAVLARRPAVALVDELAHSNAPGSRHSKRWKDIEELLAAGIDVVSTVNVQHLESLNDVVESITGIVQQETVPDDVVRSTADQVELVDMSPRGAAPADGARQRLRRGPGGRGPDQLLPPRQPDRAARAGAAVDGRPGRRGAVSLPTGAGHLGALGHARADRRRADGEPEQRGCAAPGRADRLSRAGQRADRLSRRAAATGWSTRGRPTPLPGAPWSASSAAPGTSSPATTWPTAILDFARGVNATQIVLGTRRPSRAGPLPGGRGYGGLGRRLVR